MAHPILPALQTAVWMHKFKTLFSEPTLQKLKSPCHFKKNTRCHIKPPAFKVEHLTAKFVKGQLLQHVGIPVRAHTCLFLAQSIAYWVLLELK